MPRQGRKQSKGKISQTFSEKIAEIVRTKPEWKTVFKCQLEGRIKHAIENMSIRTQKLVINEPVQPDSTIDDIQPIVVEMLTAKDWAVDIKLHDMETYPKVCIQFHWIGADSTNAD